MVNPLAPLSILVKRLHQEMKAKGLKVEQFIVNPNPDETVPTHAQVIITIAEDTPRVEIDKDLEKMLETSRQADESAKAKDARKDLESLRDDLKNPNKGIGLD